MSPILGSSNITVVAVKFDCYIVNRKYENNNLDNTFSYLK